MRSSSGRGGIEAEMAAGAAGASGALPLLGLARALLERLDDERVTPFLADWGEPALREDVQRIMARARQSGDDRLEQLARRFLR